MEKVVPSGVLSIYKKLKKAGFQAFFVGGCVRDFLMGRTITDWDFATDATPEEIQKIFPNSFYDNKFGTVGIPLPKVKESEHEGVVEITTFRTEGQYRDLRRPEKVEWGKSIEEDLSRRDFTVNAIALRLPRQGGVAQGKLQDECIDPFGGLQDIEKKIIRTFGNPSDRLNEDALRLMRAVRFATQLEFEIEKETWKAILENASNIGMISGERIRDEILKILATDHPYEGVVLLDKSGLLDQIIPELSQGKGVSQVRPGRHHISDVFTHNIESLKHCPSRDPIVRLATLLHDVGKPYVRSEDEEGHVIFYNHEVKGARIAYEICDRLRLSKKQREKVVTLIRWHMFTVDVRITDSAVRRFIRRVGIENVADMMDLRIGDRLGGGTQVAESWRLKKFKERVAKELNPPFSLNDLAIDGNDIIRELKIEPGPKIGEILQKLFEEVDEDLSKNNREYLLKRIHEIS
ncbi:MAG: HD domain-containing protein [Candidatus Levybacteria bacterium]|nr:HD domain-containing protein [Candidatus Levybacteria bacterium]